MLNVDVTCTFPGKLLRAKPNFVVVVCRQEFLQMMRLKVNPV